MPEAATAIGFSNTPPPSNPVTPSSGGSSSNPSKPVDFGPRYQVQALLGEGGMGAVYRAYDRELDRTVALKLIRPELGTDANMSQRFRQELLLASKISHKNILRIHDLGEAHGTKFISMAYVEGEDLHQLLLREGRLEVNRAVTLAKQLCAALEAAHSEGVVHRDLKPQNILLDKAGQVYVSDFGLAKSLEPDATQMTLSGQFLGTPRYMSPEQALAGSVDHRSDLYSLGLILYEMVTGEIPFKAESTLQTMYLRVHEKPQDPRQFNGDLPDYLVQIILRCLETDPAQRYQSAREILDDLQSAQPSKPPRSQQLPAPPPGKAGRKMWYAGAGVLVLGLALLAVPTVRNLLRPRAPSTQSAIGVPPLSQGKYLALLPFRVIGDKNDLGYVSDGLVEATAAKLFQMKDIHLASPTAVQSVKVDQPLEKIARQLGVNLIAQGSVQGSAAKMRITISLDDVAGGRRLWTGEFSGVPQDLLTLEDKIYAQLVAALELKPSSSEVAALNSHPTENVEAYDLYLKGREDMRQEQDAKKVQAALDLYQKALAKDSGFALAYAGLADASLSMYRHTKDSFWSDKALRAAQQAEQLNAGLPEVHFSLGSVYTDTGKTAEAISELKRALELAPKSDEGYRRLGQVYTVIGRKPEAIEAYKKAIELNPYYWENYNALAGAYYSFGENELAVAGFKKVIELEPDNAAGYDNLGVVLMRMEKWNDCIPNFEKALQIQPYYATYSNLGTAYFFLKRYHEAVQMFEKAAAMNSNDHMVMGNLADGYRWAGQPQKALATYDKAIALAYKQLAINPRDADTMGYLGQYLAKKGDPRRGLELVRRARAMDPTDVSLVYFQAVVECIAGQKGEALKDLHQALQQGYPAEEAQSDPELKNLQALPEFADMMRNYAGKPR
ncbi:MAG TPA: protein kinase [Terriglobales bacterium]|nr:protein kinase [Terriglobales bacterium]